jgi:hypothetical protein
VLKVDIEGGEFDALTAFIDAHAERGPLPIGQLQLEIHARDGRERFDYFNHWWMTLEAAGLRPFWMEPNLVYVNIVRGALPELSEVRSRSDFLMIIIMDVFLFSTHLLTYGGTTRSSANASIR